jgi:hypothetical protein
MQHLTADTDFIGYDIVYPIKSCMLNQMQQLTERQGS